MIKWSLGEVSKGSVLGYKNPNTKYIWAACEKCGRERWVILYKGKPKSIICLQCRDKRLRKRGSEHWHWKGGRTNTHGYVEIKLQSDDFFFPMAQKHGHNKWDSGYVLEHRLVMAKFLKRCLLSWEVVHHKNGIKNDNRIENLELITGKQYHLVDSLIKSQMTALAKRVSLLEAENIALRYQLESLQDRRVYGALVSQRHQQKDTRCAG